MNKDSAETAITSSAMVVIAVYAYRRLRNSGQPTSTGLSAKNLLGQGNPPSLGTFAVGWGFAFLVCSIMAEIDPGLGGGFAILIAATDFLTNGQAIFSDVITTTSGTSNTTTTTTTPTTSTNKASNTANG